MNLLESVRIQLLIPPPFRAGLVVLALLLASCAGQDNRAPETTNAESTNTSATHAEVWLRVEGMTKVQGITWVGWPNDVETALEGLDGITELNTHLEHDAFHVVYDSEAVSIEDMQRAIAKAGFEGKVIDPIATEQRPGVTLDLEKFPAKLKSVFDRARELDQLVLVDIHGPGWAPCEKMERVTYPSTEVQQALEGRYQRIVLDVEEDAQLVELLNPEVIPTAVIFDTNGIEQRRQTGHATPVDHAEWLK